MHKCAQVCTNVHKREQVYNIRRCTNVHKGAKSVQKVCQKGAKMVPKELVVKEGVVVAILPFPPPLELPSLRH